MPNDPIAVFRAWLADAEGAGQLTRPRAFCLSTVDADGHPHARTVDLKEVTSAGFVFSTSLAAHKARHIAAQPHVAATFWWDHIERQVRVVGSATRVTEEEADALFRERPRDAQLASRVSTPSAVLDDPTTLERRLSEARRRFAAGPIPRPADWSGYRIHPERVEFLCFQENRLHQRQLFTKSDGGWQLSLLEP